MRQMTNLFKNIRTILEPYIPQEALDDSTYEVFKCLAEVKDGIYFDLFADLGRVAELETVLEQERDKILQLESSLFKVIEMYRDIVTIGEVQREHEKQLKQLQEMEKEL